MSIILTGSCNDTSGRTYKVDIYDRDASPAADEILLASVPSITGSGPSKSFNAVVISKTATWKVDVNPDVTAQYVPLNSFIAALKVTNDEQRFHCRIYIDTFLEFVGYIQTDQLVIPITSNGAYTLTLTASDRLNLASNFDYDAVYAFEGDQKLRDLLLKVLESMGLFEIYADGEPILSIAHQYYENQMPNDTSDPFDMWYLNRAHFSKKLTEEEELTAVGDIFDGLGFETAKRILETVDCQKVLDTIVGDTHCFIMQDEGYYKVFYKGIYLLADTVPQYRYDRTGALLSSGKIMADITIGSKLSNDTGNYLIDNAKYTFLGPLKEVIIRYNVASRNNLITGHEWHTYDQTLETFGEVSNAGSAILYGSLPVELKLEGGDIFTKIYVRLKLGVTVKIGTYYLIRSATITNGAVDYGNLSWSLTAGTVDFITEVFNSTITGLSFLDDLPRQEITFETVDLPIPESGELSVKVELLDLLSVGGISLSGIFTAPDEITGGYQLYWRATDNYMRVVAEDPEQNIQALDYIDYTTTINSNNSETYKREINTGDDPNSQNYSRWRVYNGTDIVDSNEEWYTPAHVTLKPYGELLSWDIARFRNGTIHVLSGTVHSNYRKITPFNRLTFDSKTFVQTQARHIGHMNDYTGHFLQVNVDATGLSTLIKRKKKAAEPVRDPTYNPAAVTSGPVAEIVTGVTGVNVDVTVADLPDPDEFDETEINLIMQGTRWNNVIMHYRATPAGPGEYSIDLSGSNNRMVLHADSAHTTSDEFFIVINM